MEDIRSIMETLNHKKGHAASYINIRTLVRLHQQVLIFSDGDKDMKGLRKRSKYKLLALTFIACLRDAGHWDF